MGATADVAKRPDHRHMGYGMPLLYRRGHEVPPVVPRADSLLAHERRLPSRSSPRVEKSVRFNLTP